MGMTKDEYSVAIEAFLGELTMMATAQGPDSLENDDLAEAIALIRSPGSEQQDVVALACGIVDQYADLVWAELIDRAYSFYLDRKASSR